MGRVNTRAFEHILSACVRRLGRSIIRISYSSRSVVDFQSRRELGGGDEREPTESLSESTVYHVVTTEDATAGISSMALGEALSGQRFEERYED